MKVPRHIVKKAAIKRVRSQGGPREEELAPAPKRPSASGSPARNPTSPAHREPPAAPEIDLTADTPPKGVTAVAETECQVPAESAPEREEQARGKGPSAAYVSHPVEVPSSGPSTVAPTPAEKTEDSRAGVRPRRVLLMDDGRRAEWLVSQINLPEFQEELRVMGASAFYREAFVSVLRMSNFLAATREVFNEGEALILQARKEVEDAVRRARIEAARARATLNQLSMAEDAISARDLRIEELEALTHAAESRAECAEKRAARAEEGEKEATALIAQERAKDRGGRWC